VCSPNLIEAAKSYFLIIAAIIEEHISVVGEVVDKHDLAIEIAEGGILKFYASTLIVFLKLKVKRRCRSIEGIPRGSRDSFMQRPKEILLEINVFYVGVMACDNQ
jgi:hypothetical protein